MKHVATKMDAKAIRYQLALPLEKLQQLHQIFDEVTTRQKVFKSNNPHDRLFQETGITALFAGASGTGKTMVAEVLVNELHLDLHRIDLSSIS